MKNSFSDFKRQYRTGALIKAALLGLSAGAVCSAVALLLYKLDVWGVGVPVIAAASLGLAAVVFGIVYLFTWGGERMIAAKVDKQYSLGEKVSTMLEYSRDDTAMASLQRADTLRTLGAIDKKGFGFGGFKVFLGIFLVSVMACASMLFVPAVGAVPAPDGGGQITDPFEATRWQITALQSLIRDVEESGLEQSAKEVTLAQLRELLSVLDKTETVSDMQAQVVESMAHIIAAINRANSLAAVKAGIKSGEYVTLGTLADCLGSYLVPITPLSADGLKQIMLGDGADELCRELTELILGMQVSDTALCLSLLELARVAGEMSEAAEPEAAFSRAVSAVRGAIIAERVNISVKDMTVSRLADIFDIPLDKLPEDSAADNGGGVGDDEEDEDEDDSIQDGGLGGNQTLYGSDDCVFDPERGELVKYSEIINDPKYYPTAQELGRDEQMPESLREFLEKYYDILFDGSGEDESDEDE